MANKVLFLDIDGVLNHETFHRARARMVNKEQGLSYEIDKVSLFCLYDVLESSKDDIDIVMSSTWRMRYTPERFNRELFNSFGISLNVISSTGREAELTPEGMELARLNNYELMDMDYAERGIQIVNWLAAHKKYDHIAVVDDDSDIPSELLVKTYYRTGFNAYTVDKLVSKLNITM